MWSQFWQTISQWWGAWTKPKPTPIVPPVVPPSPPTVARATIAVAVTDTRTKKAVVGATFRLNEELRTTTNADGYAKFDDIAQGQVFYAVEHPDYVSHHGQIELRKNTDVLVEVEPVRVAAPYRKIKGQLRVSSAVVVNSLLPTIKAVRAKYPQIMTDDQCGMLCLEVAWLHRNEGWGLSNKPSGKNVRLPDGTLVAHDVLHHKPTNTVYDILRAAGAESEPQWSNVGSPQSSDRTWVAPFNTGSFEEGPINPSVPQAYPGFYDEEGPVLPLFAHAGDLFALFVRDAERAKAEIRGVADAGFQGLRVWTVLRGPYWEGPDRDVHPNKYPDYWDRWLAFVQSINEEGLKLVVSQGDLMAWTSDMAVRKAFAVRLADIEQQVGNGVYAFFDGGNEAWQNGESDPKRLAEFVSAYQEAGGQAIPLLTSPRTEEKDELDAYSIDPAQCYDVHGSRDGHFWDKIRHIFSIAYEGKPMRPYGIQSEPTGSGDLVSVTTNKHELDDEAVAAMAVMGAISRQAWVWFSGEGVRIQKSLSIERGFTSVPRAYALLPADLMSYAILHHSGETWRRERIVSHTYPDLRVDGVQHLDGRCVYLFYGPSSKHSPYNVLVTKKITGTLWDLVTGENWPINHEPGQSLSLAMNRALLFVGHIH
jgi:hypothetical protein